MEKNGNESVLHINRRKKTYH